MLIEFKKDANENIILKRLENMEFENGFKKEIERIKKDIKIIKNERKKNLKI